jgi:nucleotide-binding universal stress UspA family protein
MDNGTHFRTILAPIDGSKTSTIAGKLAVDLAVSNRARLIFVYVVDETVVDELAHSFDKSSRETGRELARSGQRYLDYLSVLAQGRGVAADTILRQGTPHLEIVDEANKQGADLIVIGYVGRRGPRRILIGSVTERVIEYAECPILIAKGDK